MNLDGGKKHEQMLVRMQHGNPKFGDASGVHGTVQMPLTDDVGTIHAFIRDTFKSDAALARVSFAGDIHFKTTNNGDSTMEVNFEVKQ